MDDGRICFVENYRVAVEERLVELPAGTLEPPEEPVKTALRELAEETGYRAARIEHLATLCMSPGILDEKMYVYAASGLTAGEMALEAGEDIRVLCLTWQEALEWFGTAAFATPRVLPHCCTTTRSAASVGRHGFFATHASLQKAVVHRHFSSSLDFRRQIAHGRPRGIGVLQRRRAVDDLAVGRVPVEFSRKLDLAADQTGNRDRGIVNRLPGTVATTPSTEDDLPGDYRSLARPLHLVQQRPRESVGSQHQECGLGTRRQDATGGLDVDLARRGRADRPQRQSKSASASRSVTCERLMRTGSSAAGAWVKRIMGPGPKCKELAISRTTAPCTRDSMPTPTRRKTQFFMRMRPDGRATAAGRWASACCQTMAALNSGLPPAD